ncbi:UDP-glucose 4-epimerase [Maioricimonas rarisocia]|uniref:UDP-glucose 4-epimerase n=1 Tax=Maioricimonas rarisocia TaxID=2528026 RepID=A0A517Z0R3_9PLAN|nr:NAD(P)-dependent oxidoreductase [Maioricimonas rarisocia]QDU36074.1 UDP-glucose 4-epimerase [Maioricimonas rarisocia]
MQTKLKQRFDSGMLVRLAADAIMINIAFALAMVIRFLLYHLAGEVPQQRMDALLLKFMTIYAQNAVPLTAVCLSVFWFSGFYTYGRAYQGKYKALIIVQAVAQAFLIYGLLMYMAWEQVGLFEIPRVALPIAGALTLGMTLATRTWSFLWKQIARYESENQRVDANKPVRKVLVIGGAGYIGSALIKHLLDRGFSVRILDRLMYGTEPIADVLNHPRLDLMQGDFRHVEKVVEAMRGMDAVVHLGAIVGDPACELDKSLTVDINLSATRMVAHVAKASNIQRFIFASTCSVYGASDEILDEHSESIPVSLYGHTKLAAERGLLSMADERFAPTLLRFATIYGLSGRTRFDLVVNLLSAKAKTEGVITVHGGDQWRPFVHVSDAALGVVKALEAPLEVVANQTFNVGSDEQNYTIRQVGELIHDRAFTAQLEVDENSTDRRNYRVSFAKIRQQLGYKPEWTLEEGIDQVFEAVANGSVTDYRDARYSNVKYLSQEGAIEVIRVDDDWSRHLTPAEPEQEAVATN